LSPQSPIVVRMDVPVIKTELGKKIYKVLFDKQLEMLDYQPLCIRISNYEHFTMRKTGKRSEKKENSKEDPVLFKSIINKLADLRQKNPEKQQKNVNNRQKISNIFDEEQEFELDNSKRLIDPTKKVPISPEITCSKSPVDDPFSWKRDQSSINEFFTSEAYEEIAEQEVFVKHSGKRNYRREGTEKKQEFNKIQKVLRDNYNREI
jgi:hypothetical protein